MMVCAGLVHFVASFVYSEENVISGREAAEQHFAREVWPVLTDKCLACHGKDSDNIRAGLELTTSATARKAGESGEAAIVPGQKHPATRSDVQRLVELASAYDSGYATTSEPDLQAPT